MEIFAAGSRERDSAARAKSGLAWALQLPGRGRFRSVVCWEAASALPSPRLFGRLQAALPCSPTVCVVRGKMTRWRGGTRS